MQDKNQVAFLETAEGVIGHSDQTNVLEIDEELRDSYRSPHCPATMPQNGFLNIESEM